MRLHDGDAGLLLFNWAKFAFVPQQSNTSGRFFLMILQIFSVMSEGNTGSVLCKSVITETGCL